MAIFRLNIYGHREGERWVKGPAVIVRAPNHDAARDIAARKAGDEGPSIWRDRLRSSCRAFDSAVGPDIVILRSEDR